MQDANNQMDLFLKCILSLQDKEECKRFLEDVCTPQEIKTLTQRLLVAKMLHNNAVYSDIVNKTGASTATISRVNRSLHGGTGSYTNLFQRLGE